MNDRDNIHIATFERTETECVRVSASRYRGKRYLDLRLWYLDPSGEWKPTRKGCTIRENELTRLIAAVEDVRAMPLKLADGEADEVAA
ncbi:MAG: transcriptional coactivator p15/PC4 family protein [bacterium]